MRALAELAIAVIIFPTVCLFVAGANTQKPSSGKYKANTYVWHLAVNYNQVQNLLLFTCLTHIGLLK